MKLFLSWSKPRSRKVAGRLREWIPSVIQRVKPWMSDEDIQKGQRWGNKLSSELEITTQGIICVTAENMREPWLNFEVGSLAKSVDHSSVKPVLLDVPAGDLTGPLALFQATSLTDREDMFRLMSSLNSACDEPLDGSLLAKSFERAWDELHRSVNEIARTPAGDQPPKRSSADKIDEILWVVRALDRRTPSSGDKPAYDRIFGDSIVIDLGDIDASLGVVEHSFDEIGTVNDFLDGLWARMSRFVGAYTYGRAWILYDPRRRRELRDIGTTWARQNGARYDRRVLTEVGIHAGMVLVALRVTPETDDIMT